MPTVALGSAVVTHISALPAFTWHLDWWFGPLRAAPGPPDLSVRLDTYGLRAPDAPPTLVDGPLLRWDDGSRLLLQHESGMVACVTDTHVDLDPGPVEPDDWRPTRQLLFSALSWWFERRGDLVLHGALVGRDGQALLVIGHSGAGKSTVASAAMRLGWQVLSDDLVIVDSGIGDRGLGRGLMVHGIPKRMTADPLLADVLGHPAAVPLPGDVRGRLVLPPGALATGSRLLRGCVVVEHDDAAGRLEPVPTADAFEAVVRAFLEAPRPDVLRQRLPLLAAVAGAGCVRLRHALDPQVRLERAGRLLEQAWGAMGPDGQ